MTPRRAAPSVARTWNSNIPGRCYGGSARARIRTEEAAHHTATLTNGRSGAKLLNRTGANDQGCGFPLRVTGYSSGGSGPPQASPTGTRRNLPASRRSYSRCMTRPWRQALPYLAGMAGVAGVTAVIWAVRPWLDIPNLAVAYLLLVLWLGARWGWPPAVSAAVLAFLAYAWSLVPPYGTLYISAPRELLNLIVLLVAAVVGGRLAASLADARAGAEAAARESGVLNEVAIAALRDPEAAAALRLLCERAVASGGLAAIRLGAFGGGEAQGVGGPGVPPPAAGRGTGG